MLKSVKGFVWCIPIRHEQLKMSVKHNSQVLIATLNNKRILSLKEHKASFVRPMVFICTFRSFSQTKRRSVERESHVTVWLGHYKGVFLLSLFFKNSYI